MQQTAYICGIHNTNTINNINAPLRFEIVIYLQCDT